MAFTYDVTTDRGKCRFLIGDTDTATSANQIFTDAEIDAVLGMNNQVIRLAAAMALVAMAASQAMILKVISIHGLSVNGASVAAALRELAAEYQRQHNEGEDGDYEGLFDYAEMVVNPASERERTWNQMLRRAV